MELIFRSLELSSLLASSEVLVVAVVVGPALVLAFEVRVLVVLVLVVLVEFVVED
jgi:hypothetical protein